MDFGLARVHASGDSLGSDPPPEQEPQSPLAASLTRAGAVLGTPKYMAPEQFASNEVTAAADQFSFCVTMWEAFYGERPYAGRSPSEIVANVLAGRRRSPARPRAIPGWLRRTCERGLSVAPSQRWPSMAALLDTLAKGSTRAGIRKALVAVGVIAVLGGAAEAYRRWELAQRVAACEATEAQLADVWNPERAQVLRAGLLATGVSFAPQTADKVEAWLDRQAADWREARVQVCLDAEVHGRWDTDTRDRSLWCLEARRLELQSLVDELVQADANAVREAVAAASSLAPVAACRDDEVLETIAAPPEADREALRAVRADVVRARNLERAGRYGMGLELAKDALPRAEALGWPPLLAEARLQLGILLEVSGAYADAAAELERAYFAAAKGVAPEVAFDAACRLVHTVGVISARHADGLHWARLADVALEDVPDGERLARAGLLVNLAIIQSETGDHGAARASLEQALAIRELALGPEHPDVANALGNLAVVHYATGAYGEARALLERSLAIQEEVLGSEHPHVADTLNNLANVHEVTGELDEAKALHERALALARELFGPEHPHVADGLNNLANVHASLGEHQAAKALHEQALAMRERTLGPAHPEVATSLGNLASIQEGLGEHDRARVLFERALAITEAALGPEHPELALSLLGLARVALAEHRPGDAVAPAERATRLREQGGVAAELLAEAQLALARALWDAPEGAGRDPARARTLAERARDALRAAGDERPAAELAEVEAWLETHALE
jgi:tetratricopeptide (TPR) repeat protein